MLKHCGCDINYSCPFKIPKVLPDICAVTTVVNECSKDNDCGQDEQCCPGSECGGGVCIHKE